LDFKQPLCICIPSAEWKPAKQGGRLMAETPYQKKQFNHTAKMRFVNSYIRIIKLAV